MAGIDNNTLLYLRGDSFEDLSLNPKVVTNNGVSLDNNCFKFGASKRLIIDNNDVFAFGTGDFTVEMEVFLTNYSESDLFVSNNNYKDFYFNINPSGKLRFDTTVTTQYSTSTILLNTWSNVCISRKDGTVYMFINGKLQNNALNNGNITMTSPRIGYHDAYTSDKIEGNIRNIRVSNIARYTEDFTPQTQPYNSITINKTNQTDTNIEFNIEKLGQETINKIEVLVNGTVSETYTDNYDNINYLIDKELCSIGNNKITIRVTFDDIYAEELSLTHKVTVNPLPLETPLLDTVERVKILTKSKQNEKDMLSSILTSKNVEVTEEDKMSDLISKVDLLDEYNDSKLWLYKAGDSEGVIVKFIYVGISSNPSTFDSDKINVYVPRGSIGLGVRSSERIDLTHYSKLYIEGHNVVGDTCRILLSKNTNIVSDGIALGELKSTSKVAMSFNISNYNDDFYIGIYQNGDVGIRQNYIYNIWLEP